MREQRTSMAMMVDSSSEEEEDDGLGGDAELPTFAFLSKKADDPAAARWLGFEPDITVRVRGLHWVPCPAIGWKPAYV